VGSLLDISGNWKTPHKTHSLGKEADIGFVNFFNKLPFDQSFYRIMLLRQVIIQDSNFLSFPNNEGRYILLTFNQPSPHFHIDMVD
jgi:hypothetical protein